MNLNTLTSYSDAHKATMPKSGIVAPKEGIVLGVGMDKQIGLGDALFSITQQRVLGYQRKADLIFPTILPSHSVWPH